MVDKKKQGKKNRASGAAFELKVRKELEAKGWIINKWMNQVVPAQSSNPLEWEGGLTLAPAKHKFCGIGRPMAIGTGFPDFIAYKPCSGNSCNGYKVVGVEAKSNGYLDKSEKEKIEWLLNNKIFEYILLAYKGDKKDKIVKGAIVYRAHFPTRSF